MGLINRHLSYDIKTYFLIFGFYNSLSFISQQVVFFMANLVEGPLFNECDTLLYAIILYKIVIEFIFDDSTPLDGSNNVLDKERMRHSGLICIFSADTRYTYVPNQQKYD